jgi:hypothetical protein
VTAARKEFLIKEKEFTRQRDESNRQRRTLQWEKVEKRYEFDSTNGKVALADLFDGRSQLLVYHFMFSPSWEQDCPSCSFFANHFDGSTIHLAIATRRWWLFRMLRSPRSKRSEAHGLEVSVGLVVRQRFQLRLPRLLHAGRKSQRQVYYNYAMEAFPREETPMSTSSPRMQRPKSFIPVPPMGRKSIF